jgi:hypothetical protein
MPEVVSIEQATEEITKWLDYKKIEEDERETQAENITKLAKAISRGTLTMDDDFNLVQVLKFPVEDSRGNPVLTKLTYKPRLSVQARDAQMQGIKASDGDARILAFYAALTGVAKALIAKLDTVDYSIGYAIVVFFT